MIEARRQQLKFGDGLIAEEIADLREDWMTHADQVLEDEQLVAGVYEALARRSPKSRIRGRKATPAEVVLRLLLLKHIRNWSYEVLEREVRANLVYRDFTRVGAAKAPDAKTMGRWGLALGAEGVERIHERVVEIAKENQVVKSADRKREQRKRWFKAGQKWRTGCEGRISVLKRRHGLRRCLYKGEAGMKRWVGLGVIADNLHHIGTALAKRKN
jgi:IS5 family transposase